MRDPLSEISADIKNTNLQLRAFFSLHLHNYNSTNGLISVHLAMHQELLLPQHLNLLRLKDGLVSDSMLIGSQIDRYQHRSNNLASLQGLDNDAAGSLSPPPLLLRI